MRRYGFLIILCLCVACGYVSMAETSTNEPSPVQADSDHPKPDITPDDKSQDDGMYTIGVVSDGDSPYFNDMVSSVRRELLVLVEDPSKITFKISPEFSAGWDMKKIETVFNAAMNDPDVDLVFVAGCLEAQYAGSSDVPLGKPVISGFVQDPDTFGLPYNEEGRSTKKNYNFVVIPLRAVHDGKVFAELVPINNLAVLVDSFFLSDAQHLDQEVKNAESKLGIKIHLVPVDISVQDVVKAIPAGSDAVYLTPPLRMGPDAWQQVIDGINQKDLPSFSAMGYEDVEKGVLAGLLPEMGDRLARRIALNIQQIMRGTPPEDLQVKMPVEEKLVINAQTAAEIGYSPNFEIMTKAVFLHREMLHPGESLTIDQAMVLGVENSADLAIKKAETKSVRQQKNQVVSLLFPQINGQAQYAQIDKDTAEAAMGNQAEKTTQVGATATQIIYNDPVLSQYRASRRSYDAQMKAQESTRLDVMANVAERFIQLLQAQALFLIEQENLKLTRSNLDLAKVRHQVGTAGPEEVYRWESQAASQKSTVIAADSSVKTANVALNQSMGVEQDKRWNVKDLRVEGDDLHFLGKRLSQYLENEKDLQSFEEFVVEYALKYSPALESLDDQISAQGILLNQYKRRFIIPELTASASYDYYMDREYPEGITGLDLPDDQWGVGLQASIPLCEGGGRVFDMLEAAATLNQLEETKRQTREYIEQNVRSIMYSIKSSYPAMKLQKEAADFSQKNLDVIQDKYARGVVSILDLLDAQNQSFVAHQNAVIAVYSYLLDIYELQRAVAWFSFEKTSKERDDFVEAFKTFQASYEKRK